MLRRFLSALVATTFPVFFVSLAHAVDMPPPEQWRMFDPDWIALSTTAMGITGNARLTPTTVTFDRRVPFKLRYISEISTTSSEVNDGIQQFSLFEFVDPRPQAILRGNHLCGQQSDEPSLPRYLAIGWSRKPPNNQDYLTMVVFRSELPPEDITSKTDGFCGSLGYFYRVPAPAPSVGAPEQ